MGILSDRQIKARCMQPSHYLVGNGTPEPVIAGVTHSVEQVEKWVKYGMSRLIPATEQVLKDFNWQPMIKPFVDHAVRFKQAGNTYPIEGVHDVDREIKIISYGLSSYGYDIRISKEDIKIFSNINATIIDPMRMNSASYQAAAVHWDHEFGLHYFILPPKAVALAHTVEYFNISRDLLITCLGKSTYARVGISPIVTPLEPEWEGDLVLEIANLIECPIRVYLETGIAQLLFHKGDEVCEVSYKDRGGKYQGQKGTQGALL